MFTADENILASGSDDKTVRIWNIKEKRGIFTGNHLDKVRSMCFLSYFNRISSGFDDMTVKLWNIKEKKEELSIDHLDIVRVDAFHLKLTFWPQDQMMVLLKYGILTIKHNGSVRYLCFSPTGKFIGTGSNENCMRLMNIEEKKDEFIGRHLE